MVEVKGSSHELPNLPNFHCLRAEAAKAVIELAGAQSPNPSTLLPARPTPQRRGATAAIAVADMTDQRFCASS